MGKGSHDPQANEPAKLAARTLTMKRSASRDLLGDALDCAASCIDAAALDAYRLDYASSAFGVPLSGHFFTLRSAFAPPPPRCRGVAGVPRGTESHGGAETAAKSHTPAHARAASKPPKK